MGVVLQELRYSDRRFQGDGCGALAELPRSKVVKPVPGLSVSTIYPAYVRGEDFLAAGDGGKAAGEFQKLVDHSGMVVNSPLASLARLGLARAYARTGDFAKARAGYEGFLGIWEEADSHLAILKQSKAEYAKVR